ncbi:hypothetical protein T4A_8133 [Trichinella pseudospiralis]|uniref:Uncharacterized protein n=1 Tax=Trichinella pseudospiralis TaxID=6337 RepID=A0A0V1DYV7_TRIPS|nr:hypothetical protein T4A_8133 [Trichinella pseudospiralis]KRZ39765.1 hypothetical protein T4C_5206 [Trichinella pseudospiralis]
MLSQSQDTFEQAARQVRLARHRAQPKLPIGPRKNRTRLRITIQTPTRIRAAAAAAAATLLPLFNDTTKRRLFIHQNAAAHRRPALMNETVTCRLVYDRTKRLSRCPLKPFVTSTVDKPVMAFWMYSNQSATPTVVITKAS